MIEYAFLWDEGVITSEDVAEIINMISTSEEAVNQFPLDFFLRVSRRNCVLIARDASVNGRHPIVGLACLSIVETLTRCTGLIEHVFIDPQYADYEIDVSLIQKLMERGLDMGLKRVGYLQTKCNRSLDDGKSRSFIRYLKPTKQKKKRNVS
ncbi:MAG: GNAT family N-acetyltransferase [Patescibacteria group bacterium]